MRQGTLDKHYQPFDSDGRAYVRAGSRALEYATNFICCGDKTDSPQQIYAGTRLQWDFGNTDNDIAAPDSNSKRKRIEFAFIDPVQVKEGAIYWQNALFGSYIDFFVVCPSGEYYLDNDETPTLASEDTPIKHFVVNHFMLGDCVFGDELNSEEASGDIPSTYKFWIEVTTPDGTGYENFRGHVSLEINRRRSVIL